MTDLNIVDLIEKNPITRLSATYNNKLLLNIQKTFTGFEQKLFVSSFYCYLNYDKNLDFIVDLDNIWIWLGFASKFTAIRTLEKHFQPGVDYRNISDASLNIETSSPPNAKQEEEYFRNKTQQQKRNKMAVKIAKSSCSPSSASSRYVSRLKPKRRRKSMSIT